MYLNQMSARIIVLLIIISGSTVGYAQQMDEMWGSDIVHLRAEDAARGQLFREGKYAMFIHWGVYSQLANKVDGKTYYGIGEWIMHKNMADISVDRYKELAKQFNPVKFDAVEIAQLAKDAGMKYIIITSKHHDGFAMYHSKADDFNIVDATPFNRDPMKELAEACRKLGLGFGFYYSHNQDWTCPGGNRGPNVDAHGNPATFDDYFHQKCLPQVKEIATEYGPIELVWFDTPGEMPKKYVEQLVEIVHKNQPHALVSGRAGHGLGDYTTLGDMEIPNKNIEGLWETVDTTNDSWGYAWYDENWKTPKTIIEHVISTVARGGTYMLNIGPRGDGTIPERTVSSLRQSGEWIRRYPQVIYGAGASPWKRALPWGDATVQGNKVYLTVFNWPSGGHLYLPGLKTTIRSVRLLDGARLSQLEHQQLYGWLSIHIPDQAPEKYVSVIELDLAGPPEVEQVMGIDPVVETTMLAEFAAVEGAKAEHYKWMEKYGEWKNVDRITRWQRDGKATWEVAVLSPGDYQVSLTYTGQGAERWTRSGENRLVWQVAVQHGQSIQNQQNASHIFQRFPIGWLNFPEPGRYHVSVSCLEGNIESASLKAIHFTPIP